MMSSEKQLLRNHDSASFQLPTNFMRHCIARHGWESRLAERILVGYRQFMKVILQHKDWRAEKILPSPLVHLAWNQHVHTDVQHYIQACQSYMGGHVVSALSSSSSLLLNEDTADDDRLERIQVTLISLTAIFGAQGVDEEIWAFPREDDNSTSRTNDFDVPSTLTTQCMQLNGWDEDFAAKAVHAYQLFLKAKVQEKDWYTTLLVPSIVVIWVWLEHDISHHDHYVASCKAFANGRVIARIPIAYDHPKLVERIQRTKALMQELYCGHGNDHRPLDDEIWSYQDYFPTSTNDHAQHEDEEVEEAARRKRQRHLVEKDKNEPEQEHHCAGLVDNFAHFQGGGPSTYDVM